MLKIMTDRIYIYTDGACKGNPGPGGWGGLLVYVESKKELYGFNIEHRDGVVSIFNFCSCISIDLGDT